MLSREYREEDYINTKNSKNNDNNNKLRFMRKQKSLSIIETGMFLALVCGSIIVILLTIVYQLFFNSNISNFSDNIVHALAAKYVIIRAMAAPVVLVRNYDKCCKNDDNNNEKL